LLFDPEDLRGSPPERSLVVPFPRGRALSKEERAFNRAVASVQALTPRLGFAVHLTCQWIRDKLRERNH
jgi:hypothetical protein